ncbi:NAD(P)/FAD-dependent oxidoreductase [Bordetella trematum]|uniref:NAD(P)/FAD-dependent oxidoreductase n=1 Tax=Bordetella trematum TaxID=123899 RepID=UPI003989F41B
MQNEGPPVLQADVLIIGASHAGAECAQALRAAGYAGRILLLDAQDRHPYQRPPLSKGVLAGHTDAERLTLLSPQACAQRDITFLPGMTVSALLPQAHRAQTQDGRDIHYRHCVIATGARARLLALPEGLPCHAIRQFDDALTLRQAMLPGHRLIIIGGGYLGLEAASSAAKLGLQVTVLEQSTGLMAGKVSPETAARLQALHEQAGIRILRQARIRQWRRDSQGWQAVLDDGSVLPTDLVLQSVGAQANDALARAAGLRCDNGIVIDAACRSSAPDIYAIGDCASQPRGASAAAMRIESVQNALEQARCAAAHIAGATPPPSRPPSFWSEQQGCRLQMAGLIDPGLAVQDRVFDTAKGWLVERHQGGQLAVVEAVDSPVEFMRAVKRIGTASDEPAHALLH